MSSLPTGDVRILRDAAGSNPGGTRFIYLVTGYPLDPMAEQRELERTGYEAIIGKTDAPNLHPREGGGRKFVLDAARVEQDFVKI